MMPGEWTTTEWWTVYRNHILFHKISSMLFLTKSDITQTTTYIMPFSYLRNNFGDAAHGSKLQPVITRSWRWFQNCLDHGQHLNEFMFLPMKVTTVEATTLTIQRTLGPRVYPCFTCFSPKESRIVSPLFKLVSQNWDRISGLNRCLQRYLIQQVKFFLNPGVTKYYSCWIVASESRFCVNSKNFCQATICPRHCPVCRGAAMEKTDTGLRSDSLKSNYITLHPGRTSLPCPHTNLLLIAYLKIGMTFAVSLCAAVVKPLQLRE